jgi:ABC-type transporter Mla subunit MlaD
MRSSRNEVLAGALILAALVVLTVFLVVVGKFGTVFTGSNTYRVQFADSLLLRPGSPVAVNGLKVGQVLDLDLVEAKGDDGAPVTRVEARFELPRRVRLRTGARATIQSTLTGIVTLLIEQGGGGGHHADGDLVASYEQPSLASLGDKAESLFDKEIPPVLAQLRKTAATFEETASGLRLFLERNEPKVNTLATKLEGATDRLTKTIDTYAGVGKRVDATLTANRMRLDTLLSSLRDAAGNLEEFSRLVRRQPWRLVRKSPPPKEAKRDLVDAAREYAQGATALNDALRQLSALTGEKHPVDGEARKRLLAAMAHVEKALAGYRKAEGVFWERLGEEKP